MTADELLLLELRNERLKYDRESQTRAFAKYRANLEVINRLRSISLWPSHLNTPEFAHIIVSQAWMLEVTAENLPNLRTVFAKVEAFKNHYDIADAEAGTIKVYLDLGFPDASVRLYYVKPLPPDSRCKIVTRTYASHELECSV